MRLRTALATSLAALALTSCASLPRDEVTATEGTLPSPAVTVATATPTTSPPTTLGAPPPSVAAGDGTLLALLERGAAAEPVSSRFEAVVRVAGVPELPGPVEFRLSGASDEANGTASMLFDLSALGALVEADPDATAGIPPELSALFEQPMEIIVVGDTSWIRSGLSELLGAPTPWLEAGPEVGADLGGFGMTGGADPSAAFASLDPHQLLAELGGPDVTVAELGPEVVRGAETTRYRVELDVASLVGGLVGELGVDSLQGTPPTATVDLWLDAEGRFRKLAMTMASEEPTGPVEVSLVFEVYDIGADLGITPPPASEVTPMDELDLERLFGFGMTS